MLAHDLCSHCVHQSQEIHSSTTLSLHLTHTSTFVDLSDDFSGVLLGDLGHLSGISSTLT